MITKEALLKYGEDPDNLMIMSHSTNTNYTPRTPPFTYSPEWNSQFSKDSSSDDEPFLEKTPKSKTSSQGILTSEKGPISRMLGNHPAHEISFDNPASEISI